MQPNSAARENRSARRGIGAVRAFTLYQRFLGRRRIGEALLMSMVGRAWRHLLEFFDFVFEQQFLSLEFMHFQIVR